MIIVINNKAPGDRKLLFKSQHGFLLSCVILDNPLTLSDLVTLIHKVGIVLAPLVDAKRMVKDEIISFY